MSAQLAKPEAYSFLPTYSISIHQTRLAFIVVPLGSSFQPYLPPPPPPPGIIIAWFAFHDHYCHTRNNHSTTQIRVYIRPPTRVYLSHPVNLQQGYRLRLTGLSYLSPPCPLAASPTSSLI
ncbi:hypothetical protein PtB15_10B359 [Puccinia triticina]|nr:hypothetical protein PtB15_10B359 [Puccinia triticina]